MGSVGLVVSDEETRDTRKKRIAFLIDDDDAEVADVADADVDVDVADDDKDEHGAPL